MVKGIYDVGVGLAVGLQKSTLTKHWLNKHQLGQTYIARPGQTYSQQSSQTTPNPYTKHLK
jgi:hypothetical protein